MPKFKLDNGDDFDAEFTLTTEDSVRGLVIESWGPKHRNPQYAAAFERVLERLVENGISFINVYVASQNLKRAYPNIEARAISIAGSKNISLSNSSAQTLRKEIGREVALLREAPTPNPKGGNRFKRVLLHHPLLSATDWRGIAEGNPLIELYAPTAKYEELDSLVSTLLQQPIDTPKGVANPRHELISTTAYARDPRVKAWVLTNSAGSCEACENPAPFKKTDGLPYLEVHHLIPLSEGGSDTINNALAVCPNCHRHLHFGADRATFANKTQARINRLTP